MGCRKKMQKSRLSNESRGIAWSQAANEARKLLPTPIAARSFRDGASKKKKRRKREVSAPQEAEGHSPMICEFCYRAETTFPLTVRPSRTLTDPWDSFSH